MTKTPIIHTYPNGLRLVYESPNTTIPQTYIRAFCHVGSIHEPSHLKGAAHFVEHMCFRGSSHFPSWAAVNEPISKSGAYFNASTDKQYTVFKLNCLDTYVHPFLHILSDIMLHSKLDKDNYKLELNIVKEELKKDPDTSYIEKLVFKGTVYENDVDHISYHHAKCLPYNEVLEFYHKHYVPENMVLSIVSSIPFRTILRYLASTDFSKPPSCPKRIPPILNPMTTKSLVKCESEYAFKSSESEVTTIELGVQVCNQFQSEEYYILNLLRQILSGSMSSRLFVELREKRGLTYNSGVDMILYELGGIFVIRAISDTTRIIRDGKKPGVIPVLFEIVDDIIKRGITEAELKSAKTAIRNSLKMGSIAGEDRAGYNGIRVMLHNDKEILNNDQIYDNCYRNITRQNMQEIIQKYFSPKRFYFSVVGGKLPSKSVLRNFLINV